MTTSTNNSESMELITCSKCSGTFEINPNSANTQGHYSTRCPLCGKRIIRQAITDRTRTQSAPEISPAPENPQSESTPTYFSSTLAYEAWRADISKTITKVKLTFYSWSQYVGFGDLGEPLPWKTMLRNPFL